MSLFEATQDLFTQDLGILDGLELVGDLFELVMTEVRLGGTGGCDERAVSESVAGARSLVDDGVLFGVDLDDATETHVGVGVLLQDRADGRSNFACRQNARRHLVEQRLEEVLGGGGDEDERRLGLREGLGRGEGSESRTDDDYLSLLVSSRVDVSATRSCSIHNKSPQPN